MASRKSTPNSSRDSSSSKRGSFVIETQRSSQRVAEKSNRSDSAYRESASSNRRDSIHRATTSSNRRDSAHKETASSTRRDSINRDTDNSYHRHSVNTAIKQDSADKTSDSAQTNKRHHSSLTNHRRDSTTGSTLPLKRQKSNNTVTAKKESHYLGKDNHNHEYHDESHHPIVNQRKLSARRLTKAEVIRMLIKEEADYVDKLNTLIKVFVRPLSDHTLSAKHRHILFSNIKEVYSVHVSIQSDLEFGGEQDIADITEAFINNRNALDVHSEYSYHLPKALQLLEELKSSEPNVYKKILSGEIPGLRLRDLLSSVSAIIPAYSQHLQDLNKIAKNTDDRLAIEKALNSVKDISEHSALKMKDMEIRERLSQLETQITSVKWGRNSLTSDFGRLLMKGPITTRKTDTDLDKERYAFILDQLLIITKPLRNEKYVFEQALNLSRVSFTEETRSGQIQIEPAYNEGASLFFAGDSKNSTRKMFEEINKARERLHPVEAVDDEHTFVLCTFKDLTECDECKLLLKGMYSQGYYCTKTKKQAHLNCLHGAKRLNHEINATRAMVNTSFEVPQSMLGSEKERQCFGGFFGRIAGDHSVKEKGKSMKTSEMKGHLVEAVQDKLTLLKTGILKGGFRYMDLNLKTLNRAAPLPFIMWESKNRGVKEQKYTKAGFIDYLCKHLTAMMKEISLADIEDIIKHYNGQINPYHDTETGELYIAGYYQEIENVASSEDETGDDFLINHHRRMELSAPNLSPLGVNVSSTNNRSGTQIGKLATASRSRDLDIDSNFLHHRRSADFRPNSKGFSNRDDSTQNTTASMTKWNATSLSQHSKPKK